MIENSAMVIEISACDSAFDTVIFLINSTYDVLFSNDDSDQCSTGSLQSWLITDCLEPGHYFIGLFGWNHIQVGQYSISLACTQCSGIYIFIYFYIYLCIIEKSF